MVTFLKTIGQRWLRLGSGKRNSPFERWQASKRYVALLLILLVVGTWATEARRAADGRAAGEPDPSSDPTREADLRWLKESGSDLRGRTLAGANLTGADLSGADLSGADLTEAVLVGTHLRDATLAGATLQRANLHYAILRDADLQGADLRGANLQWADLQDVDLRDAQLANARLDRAHLYGAILPDGTPWGPQQDLARFTNPQHPAYWEGSVE